MVTRPFLLLALCFVPACGQARADAGAPPAPKVKVAEPLAVAHEEASEYTGRAEAVDDVEIRPRIAGYITKVAFHEGDLVKKGDLLFVIDPRSSEAAIARAHADVLQARADLELSERDTKRAEQLINAKTIAERDWDAQKQALASIKAREESASAALKTAELDLDYCHVRAPVAGRVGRIVVTLGNLVGPTTQSPLATVVSQNPLHVYVDVDEAHALTLGRALLAPDRGEGSGRKVGVAHVGFADETAFPHDARIDFLDNRVDPKTGTQKVRVVVDNTDGTLSPGLFARVRIDEGVSHDVLLVQDRAISTDQDRRFVYVVDAQNKVQYRAVKLGPAQGNLRIVRDGVKAGDQVIVTGLQRVRPGATVTFDKVAMNAEVAK